MPSMARTSQPPSFAGLFHSYLRTYNTHDLRSTLSYLSPSCVSYYRNVPVLSTPKEFEDAYRQHWEKNRNNSTECVYMKEFTGGVEVVLREETGRKSVVRYWYGWEGGEWRQVRHEILEGV